VNTYAIWVDLVDSSQDLEFADAVHQFLTHFAEQLLVESYSIERRKFGFGPEGLGEFHIRIQTKNLDLLDQMFHQAATRAGTTEVLHAAVFSKVKNFKSALYRSFPDEVRK
jgi:hypothetical protein